MHWLTPSVKTRIYRWERFAAGLPRKSSALPITLGPAIVHRELDRVSGKLMRTIMAGLAEFERDLVRGRVKLGLAAARARGAVLGRQDGQRPSDKKAKKVLAQHKAGLSSRR